MIVGVRDRRERRTSGRRGTEGKGGQGSRPRHRTVEGREGSVPFPDCSENVWLGRRTIKVFVVTENFSLGRLLLSRVSRENFKLIFVYVYFVYVSYVCLHNFLSQER